MDVEFEKERADSRRGWGIRSKTEEDVSFLVYEIKQKLRGQRGPIACNYLAIAPKIDSYSGRPYLWSLICD